MNAINQWYRDEEEAEAIDAYTVHMRRETNEIVMKSHRHTPSKRTKAQPTNTSGLHRRRNKRFAW